MFNHRLVIGECDVKFHKAKPQYHTFVRNQPYLSMLFLLCLVIQVASLFMTGTICYHFVDILNECDV